MEITGGGGTSGASSLGGTLAEESVEPVWAGSTLPMPTNAPEIASDIFVGVPVPSA